MKTKEEILKRNVEAIAKCSVKYNVTHQGILNAMEEYATQYQKDMCYHPLPYRLAKSDVNFECTLCGKFI